MNHYKHYPLLAIICIAFSIPAFCQRPPDAFFNGLDNITKDPVKAKQLFFTAISEDSVFYGSYNFLGVLYDNEKKYDSAIYFLEKSVHLNNFNINSTKEMSLYRLSRMYLLAGNLDKAYTTAVNGIKEFPNNKQLLFRLKENCLWAYNIKYGGLAKEYLSTDVQKEYSVNSISQEYLIMRNITINSEPLLFSGQSYDSKKNMDILHCTVESTKEKIELRFKLNWDIYKTLGDNMPDYKVVYDDKSIDKMYRIGAIISEDNKTDILKELEKE